MNILQILPQLNVGGVETGTVDLAKYLIRHGHRCVVVSAGGNLVDELRGAGISHYELPVESKAF
ncbi:MAG: glycosyl transferase family 1, partial [Candidatus Omnitrophota bacterium]